MTQPQQPAGLRGWVAGRRPTGNGLAISAIVAGAFLLSYTSLFQLALACGYSPLLARVWPILVDGFTAYCSWDAWHAYQQRRKGRVFYDGLVVLAATGASALFQAEAATAAWLLERPPVGLVQAVHVVPAVAALLALEIGMQRRSHSTAAQEAAAVVQPRQPQPPAAAAGSRPERAAVRAQPAAALPAAIRPTAAAQAGNGRPPESARALADGSARARVAALVAEEAAGRRPRLSGAEAAALLGNGVKERWATELLRQERERLDAGRTRVSDAGAGS
jgi:hypothetical protein